VIYSAYDRALVMPVAIKEYLPEALVLRNAEAHVVLRAGARAEHFEQGLQAFIDEAELLARCAHPSLLRVLRLIRCHGTAYRVMPCCPYPTLFEYRRQRASPPPAATLRSWFEDLLGALETLHAEGCVHGAIAPRNILLQLNLRPLLLDLDAVRGVLVSDRTQSLMATLEPCFQPIEQRAPVSYMVQGPWSDLYSLAATMHFCISGKLPPPPHAPRPTRSFEPMGMVWQQLRADHPTLGDEPPWLRVIDACLSDDPQDRPQSVTQARTLIDAQPAPVLIAVPKVESPLPPATAAEIAAAQEPVPGPADDGRIAGTDPPAAGTPSSDHTVASISPRDDPRAEPQRQASAVAVLQRRSSLLAVGVAALLAVTTALAILAWLGEKPDASAPLAQVPLSPAAASPNLSAAVPSTSISAPTSAEALPSLSPGASGPTGATPPAPADAAAPQPERSARLPSSPRQLCAGRERYELLQCMQIQCAKRAWAKHEQCRRLREENRLS
jgi:serine/threonine protein kinase